MDKSKAITAYRKGFITLKECSQITGMDAIFIQKMAIAADELASGEQRIEKQAMPH